MNFNVPMKTGLIIGLLLVAGGMPSLPAGAANKNNRQTTPTTKNPATTLPTTAAIKTAGQPTLVTTSSLTTGTTGTAALVGRNPFPRPQSHAGNWLEYHGRSADVNVTDMRNACLVCHEKTDCISCHNVRAPRDHTNTWRTLSHGFMAEGNRDRCLTCHKQDFCVRCHNETAPRSHRGNWASRHCTWCHYGSGLAPADNCVVCHRRALHTSAPHPVNSQLICALCHN